MRIRNGKFQAQAGGKSKTFSTQADAKKWEAGVLHGFITFDTSRSQLPTTVGEILNYTYEHRWAGMKSEEDLYRNGQHVSEAIGIDQPVALLGERRIGELIRNHFKDKVSPATVNRKLSALSAMTSTAYDLDLISSKPSIKSEKEPEGRQRFLTEAEEEAILGWLGERHPDLVDVVKFLIDTGMRVSEAINLQWANLETDGLAFHDGRINLTSGQTKTSRSRTIPLTSAALAILMRRRDMDTPFAGIHYRRLALRFEQAAAALELGTDVVLHTCRHTFASRLVQRGVDLYVVAKLLGHSSIVTTQRYAHLHTANMDDAISVLQGCKNDRSDTGQLRQRDEGSYRFAV